MATSLDTLSLSQLLDLAIGMPHSGAVHFAAMRKLLQAVLGHLDVRYLTTQEPWPGQLSGPSLADVAADVKDIKKKMSEVLGEDASAKAKPARVAKKSQEGAQEDMSHSQDLREEIDKIKTTQTQMAQKIKQLAAAMKKLEEEMKKLREDIDKWKEESSEEMSQQLEAILQEMKSDLQKMEEQQEMRNTMLEQLVTGTVSQLKEQLDEIGEIAVSVQEEQERAKAECKKCTLDVNVLLGELLQRCEKLEEQVDSLESWQMAVGKLENLQNTELMQSKDATVVQMQRDYEKLNFLSGSLQKDSQEKQKAIEMLFQSLEKLQKEKADEQDMLAAMDVKADKAALGSKVNCSQFEANMERLDERMQELLSQISGQKQHWNKMQQQLSSVEEEKLDRQELKAFRNEMENMWKRSIEEIKNMMKESDSGAGIKKQLPVPFTCLSCDRMITVQVPGQCPKTLPHLQPLPPRKEPQQSQRRPVVRGSGPRGLQAHGDHQSSSFTLPPIQDSLQNRTFLQGITALPNKPRVTQVLGSAGHISRSRSEKPPVLIRTQAEPGPVASRVHRPDTIPGHGSRAPRLLPPLQPHESSTAPK